MYLYFGILSRRIGYPRNFAETSMAEVEAGFPVATPA